MLLTAIMLNSAVATTAYKQIGLSMFESISVVAVLPQSCTHNVFASKQIHIRRYTVLAEVA